MIENLYAQREAIEAQISDIKSAEIRKEISELEQKLKVLHGNLAAAKEARKSNDLETQKLLAKKNAEIADLKQIYFSDCYFISGIENQMKETGAILSEKKRKLEKVLEVV
jgi:hypothetical protein